MCTCPKCGHTWEPLVLDGAKPRGRTMMTFDAWIESLNGADAIPEDHEVFRYADGAGLPRDFVELAWSKFQRAYSGEGKRYRDWGKVFRKAVEGNWFRLWSMNRTTGEYFLTADGATFKRWAEARAQ